MIATARDLEAMGPMIRDCYNTPRRAMETIVPLMRRSKFGNNRTGSNATLTWAV